MKAAVVHAFGEPPRYDSFEDPVAKEDEVLIDVRASALTPLTRSQAAGGHYSSHAVLPFVPGVDGVGRLSDGTRVYFAFPDKPFGAMAERVAINKSFVVPIPDDVDDVVGAAIANPGMSSWAALTERAKLVPGESVLINGATGSSGRLAIQIAKHLGANKIIATGRNPKTLETLGALGADTVISLTETPDALTKRFREEMRSAEVRVVLDYLWGSSAEQIITSVTGTGGRVAEPRIRFVQIGSMGGPTIAMPASALRSSGLELLGSGLGSNSYETLIVAIGAMMKVVRKARLDIATEAASLSEVGSVWSQDTGPNRLVLTTGS